MCGIIGLLNLDGTSPAYEQMKKMTDTIVHRGPDEEGIWIGGPIGLGFRRLSIIDIEKGHASQPMSTIDQKIWLIFNGEIYNYLPLRAMLEEKGHHFRSKSDTEVIIYLYKEYKEKCVDYLQGMFSFAIWDVEEEKLFVARDCFGIKPLYYHLRKDFFIFGSEIKSILMHPAINKVVDRQSLYHYLTFQYVPDPQTMYEGIQQLKAGQYLIIARNKECKIYTYFKPKFAPVERPIEDYIEELREGLKESVTLHMQSDVKRGCFLSSGIDSTIIASLMSKRESISTFSVGFEGNNNETIIARQTAKELGTTHVDQIITHRNYFDSLSQAVWHLDEPVADPSAIALFILSKLAASHVKVILSGEGADELFGGYRIYREPQSLSCISWLPDDMKKALLSMIQKLPSFYGKNYLRRGLTPLEERFLGNANVFSEEMKAKLAKFQGMMLAKDLVAPYYAETKGMDPVTRMQMIDLQFWLTGDILIKADKLSMAHSLEVRVPFLDKKVFEIARKIPVQYRIANNTTKYILRKAAEGIIPEQILQRPKLGFPVPLHTWLQKKELMGEVIECIRASQIDEYFHLEKVERLAHLHLTGKENHARRIWTVYIFALWHQRFLKS